MTSFQKTSCLTFLMLVVICPKEVILNEKPLKTINSPGLSFQPIAAPINGSVNTLLWIIEQRQESYEEYVKTLDNFLTAYKDHELNNGSSNSININSFGSCTQENHYGYNRNSPCVFLKLENTDSWLPEYYKNSKELPESMPTSLKDYISVIEITAKPKMTRVWISCEGEKSADKEFVGPIFYSPDRGFPAHLFEHQISNGYLSPLVAVHFEQPKRGVVIYIECKLWARNIIHNPKENIGSVHFQLLID